MYSRPNVQVQTLGLVQTYGLVLDLRSTLDHRSTIFQYRKTRCLRESKTTKLRKKLLQRDGSRAIWLMYDSCVPFFLAHIPHPFYRKIHDNHGRRKRKWVRSNVEGTLACHISFDSPCTQENDCVILIMDMCRNQIEMRIGDVRRLRLSRDSHCRVHSVPRVIRQSIDVKSGEANILVAIKQVSDF